MATARSIQPSSRLHLISMKKSFKRSTSREIRTISANWMKFCLLTTRESQKDFNKWSKPCRVWSALLWRNKIRFCKRKTSHSKRWDGRGWFWKQRQKLSRLSRSQKLFNTTRKSEKIPSHKSFSTQRVSRREKYQESTRRTKLKANTESSSSKKSSTRRQSRPPHPHRRVSEAGKELLRNRNL